MPPGFEQAFTPHWGHWAQKVSLLFFAPRFPKCINPPQIEVEVLLEVQCETVGAGRKTLVGRSVWGLNSLLGIPKCSKGIIRVRNGNGEIKRTKWRPAQPVAAVY